VKKNIEKRCKRGAIASHCPKTCDKCEAYKCADSKKKFVLPSGENKKCGWIAKKNTEKRCLMPKVRETCRYACEYCPGASTIDSTIISSMWQEEKIMEWLASVGKTSKPNLLFRASRDGWDASGFHRLCDGKGATVTVMKGIDGYIFGGYTDVAWESVGVDSWDGIGEYKSSVDSFFLV